MIDCMTLKYIKTNNFRIKKAFDGQTKNIPKISELNAA